MKIDITTLFLIIIVGCLGIALGSLVQGFLDRRSNSRRRQLPEPLVPPQPVSPAVPGGEKPGPGSEGEILRTGHTHSGALWLEMDGVRVSSRASLHPDQRTRLIGLLGELRPWLEASPVSSASTLGQPQPAISSTPSVAMGKPAAIDDKPAVTEKSFLEQIDDILQAKLMDTPYKNRGISLKTGPGGIVLVIDGLNKYEGIESVPDPEIQALIRQSVAEWEKSSR